MRRKNFIRTLTRALYAGGTVFFIAGLLLLAVSSPALALQNRAPASAQNALPAAVEPASAAGVFSDAKAHAKVVYRETIADASQRLIDNLFQGEQPAACPCAGGNADIQNALLQGTPCPCLTITPPVPGTPGTGTSVGFYGGCVCSCDGAYATVCNAGGDDMLEAIDWQLYNNPSGSPTSGQVVASGSIGPLASGQCVSLDAAPPLPGNYAYRLVDEDGTVIWSNSCSVGGDCFPGTSTATSQPSATATSPGTGPTSTATLPGGVTPTAPGVEVTLTPTPSLTLTPPTGGTATATRTARPPLPMNLSAVCSYVDEDTMLWKVANNTDAAIDFTWQVVGSSESGSGTVDARGSTYFETSAGSKTVQLLVNGEVVDTEASQPPCKQALDVSYICTANGLVWSITNSNSFTAEYEWSIDGGAQTGSGTLAPGQTVTVATTTAGAHTFTLTWTDDRPGEHVTVASSPADSCPVVTPTATAPGVEITLTSTATSTATSTQPVVNTATYTPTSTSTTPANTATYTPTSTSTVPVNTATFTPTSTNTVPATTATFTPTSTATAPGVQITLTSTPTPTSTNTQPVVNTATFTPTSTATAPGVQITLTSTPTPTRTNTQPVVNTATFTPTATNTSPVIINTATFTPTITSTAPGVQITLTFTPTPTRTNTLPAPTATFTPTVTLTPPLTIITLTPAPAELIGLSSICAYPTDTTLLWSVTNPTAVAANFTWRVVGSTETGTGIVPANSTVYFNTSAGSKVVELLVNGQVIATVSSAPPCRLPITVNYVCESPTTINWYVTNGNNITVPYVWAVDNAASGESQVGPNTNQVFATTGLGQHTVTITWLIEPLGPRAVQLTANVASCGGVVTTPTQLVTLPPPAITSTPVIIPQTGGDMLAPALLTSLIGRVFATIGLLLFGAAFTVTAIFGRWRG